MDKLKPNNNNSTEILKYFRKNINFTLKALKHYPAIFCNNLPPGSGKTRNTVETYLKKNVQFIYVARTHQTVEDNISDKYGILHLEGKNRLCENKLMKKLNKMGYKLSCENINC